MRSDEAEEARSGEEEISGDEEPADGEDLANSVGGFYFFVSLFVTEFLFLYECKY